MPSATNYSQMSLEELEALAHTDIDAAFEHMHRMRIMELKKMSEHELEAIADTDTDAAMELYERHFFEIEAESFLEDHPDKPIWMLLNDEDLRATAKEIVTSSASVEEAKRRIRDELGYPYGISIHSHVPSDRVGHEARLLVQALGCPTMRNGAMVTVMMQGHNGIISF